MARVWDRREARISYQVPVGVFALEERKVVNTVALNLSRGGMFIDTLEQMPVGSKLMCNVPFGRDSQAMQVEGRVAWLRPECLASEQAPHGMGIEFVDLSDEESDQLETIVGAEEEQSHPVRMHLEGMGGAMAAQAQLTPQGIFFRTQLPFLSLDSLVDFAFEGDGDEDSYRGKIVGVEVHKDPGSPVPRLQVQVELVSVGHQQAPSIPSGLQSDAAYELMQVDRQDTERTVIDAALDDAIDDAIGDGMEAVSARGGEPAFVTGSRVRVRQEGEAQDAAVCQEQAPDSTRAILASVKSGRLRWLLAGVFLIAVIALGVASGASEPSARGDGVQSKSLRVREVIEGHRTEGSSSIGVREREEALARIRASALAEHDELGDLSGDGAAEEDAAESQSNSKPEKLVASSQARHQRLGGVLVKEDPSSLVLRVPFRGKVDGAQDYLLSDPPAIAVNLPYARPVHGFHDKLEPRSNRVRSMWIRERLGGLHFRAFFAGEPPSCNVSHHKSVLEIRCSEK